MNSSIGNAYHLRSDRIGAVKTKTSADATRVRAQDGSSLRELASALTGLLPFVLMLAIAAGLVLARVAALRPELLQQLVSALSH
jgi:hypothetical protein